MLKLHYEFENYEVMIEQVEQFFKENYHLVSIIDSRKNKELNAYQYLEWACVHYQTEEELQGNPRKRNKMCYKPLGCQMGLRVNYEKKKNKYVIKKFDIEHINKSCEKCHELDPEIFKINPKNRRLNADEIEEVIRMKNLGADAKKVQAEMSTKTGKAVQLRDIHNIVQKGIKRKLDQVTQLDQYDNLDVAYLEAIIQEQVKKDNKDYFQYGFDETESKIYLIFYQTDEMRLMYQRYGQILFIDGTYNLNSNNYSVYLFVVEDNNGQSQVVGAALTVYEREVCLDTIVSFFKQQVDISHTKVIMTDKDLVEHEVLSRNFPEAKLLLCKFHVIKTFKEKCKNKELLNLLEKMINASNIATYESLRQEFLSIKHNLSEYFNENWHNIREKWVLAYRNELPTLHNNTNNRVESTNSKLKQFIKKNSKMSECINGLMKYLNFKSKQKQFKDYLNIYKCRKNVFGSSDHIIKEIYKVCSSYAAQIVSNSYRTSLASNYKFKTIDNIVKIYSVNDTYLVSNIDSDTPSCNCLQSSNMILPCKHIFYLRRVNSQQIFTQNMIPSRWRNIKLQHDQLELTSKNYRKSIIIPNLNSTKSQKKQPTSQDNEKIPDTFQSRYSKSHRFIQELASTFVNNTEEDYNDKMQILLVIKQMWEENIKFEIKPISNDLDNIQLEVTSNPSLGNSAIDASLNVEKELQTSSIELDNQKNDSDVQIDTNTAQNIQVKSILIDKTLLKSKRRGRPKNSKNKNNLDSNTKPKQKILIEKKENDSKLLALILINEQIIPEILNNSRLIEETDILVQFPALTKAKRKLIDVFKSNISNLHKYFPIDGLSQLQSLLSVT